MANGGTEQMPQAVNVKLTLPNAQLILNVLAERPHREVAPLIADLMGQIQKQLKPKTSLAEGVEERNAALKAGLKPVD